MKTYKAIVKGSEGLVIITSDYDTKADFIRDLRGNGYKVNVDKVKTAERFDYIMEHTNCCPWDWKEN